MILAQNTQDKKFCILNNIGTLDRYALFHIKSRYGKYHDFFLDFYDLLEALDDPKTWVEITSHTSNKQNTKIIYTDIRDKTHLLNKIKKEIRNSQRKK